MLDATAALLEQHGVLELKVVEIARKVGTSPATFYQYFRDVDEAVLALAEDAGDDIAAVARVVRGEWRGEAGLATARALVDGFLSYWDKNRAVLRSRNLAAQEGDERFREVRVRTLSEITDPLTERIAQFQREGWLVPTITPYAAAGAMVAMLERMGGFQFEFEARGVSRAAMVETLTVILHQVVTGSATG